jgi:hypothetical protein
LHARSSLSAEELERLRVAYVTGTATVEELAEAFGLK